MNILISLMKQHALAIFCTLTIALSFAATLLPLRGEAVAVVMVFIPALMALALAALSDGKAGVRSLLGKLTRWRISLKWVVIALALALVVHLIPLPYSILTAFGVWRSARRYGGPSKFANFARIGVLAWFCLWLAI